MSLYEFNTSGRVIYGAGCLARLKEIAPGLGKKALLVCGKASARKSGSLERVHSLLKEASVKVVLYDGVESDPSIQTVDEGASMAGDSKCDLIVGLGGGSAIDAAKAISGVVTIAQAEPSETPQQSNNPRGSAIIGEPRILSIVTAFLIWALGFLTPFWWLFHDT